MQSQKRILTLLLISGASLLPLALYAVDCSTPENAPSSPIDFRGTSPSIYLKAISTCRVGLFNTKGSEIVAYDSKTQRLFVVNQAQEVETLPPTLDVINIGDPFSPKYEGSIDLSTSYKGDSNVSRVLPTSVAVKNGIVAVAVHPYPDPTIKKGRVLLYYADLDLSKPSWIRNLKVGSTPDMLTFTPNGKMILVANTGSPPVNKPGPPPQNALGSVSLIDIHRGRERAQVKTIDFSAFEKHKEALRTKGVRIYKDEYGDWSVAQSLQPEYIAVANNSLAWVGLEVNNAVAVLDVEKEKITDILPLGVKNHNRPQSGFVGWNGVESSNGFDASDKDNKINIANWPVYGMYQPDAMEAYQPDTMKRCEDLDHRFGHGNLQESQLAKVDRDADKGTGRNNDQDRCETPDRYLVTANEGTYFKFQNIDNGPDERIRVKDVTHCNLDPNLKEDSKLGRLRVSNWQCKNKDGKPYDKVYAFSSRSFSIWSKKGKLVFDSGDDFERIQEKLIQENPALLNSFNSGDDITQLDDKSDDQGVQPDGLTIGKLDNRYYVFVVLQRVGGIMVYDITAPKYPRFQQYINNRNFEVNPKDQCTPGFPESPTCASAGDLGPEGVLFISKADSPTKEPLLVVANQTSGSTTLYRIERTSPPPH